MSSYSLDRDYCYIYRMNWPELIDTKYRFHRIILEEDSMDKVKEALNHIKSNYLRQTFREDWRENSITKSIHDAISALNDKLDDLKKEINQ